MSLQVVPAAVEKEKVSNFAVCPNTAKAASLGSPATPYFAAVQGLMSIRSEMPEWGLSVSLHTAQLVMDIKNYLFTELT